MRWTNPRNALCDWLRFVSDWTMSGIALDAFHRLTVQPRLDSTAMYVLYHLALRHDEKKDVAWPSIRRIMSDLDRTHGTVHAALRRLEAARLIKRISGGGRSRTTRYQLPWLGTHRLNPKSDSRIHWPREKQSSTPHPIKQSSTPDGSDPKTVQANEQNRPAGKTETVQPTGHENSKTSKRRTSEEEKDWKTARDACREAIGSLRSS